MIVNYPYIAQILLTEEELQQRVQELGREISADYAAMLAPGETVLVLGALKGVFIFMADLCRHLTIPITIHFMDVVDMENRTRKTGLTEIDSQIIDSMQDQHVLLLEDIVDAGLTLNYTIRSLNIYSPKSVTVCTLFSKEEKRLIDIPIKYIGFDIGNHYVVGYGLDYKEKYRNLPFLGQLHTDAMD